MRGDARSCSRTRLLALIKRNTFNRLKHICGTVFNTFTDKQTGRRTNRQIYKTPKEYEDVCDLDRAETFHRGCRGYAVTPACSTAVIYPTIYPRKRGRRPRRREKNSFEHLFLINNRKHESRWILDGMERPGRTSATHVVHIRRTISPLGPRERSLRAYVDATADATARTKGSDENPDPRNLRSPLWRPGVSRG